MAYYDKESAEMQQEAAQLMIKCAELARENDMLREQMERLTFRIENLRAALQSIENVDREDEDLCSWWALEALREDSDFVKDTRDER